MGENVEQILQRINFIERDIELHRNILVSLKEDQEQEIEEVIRKIISMNERVEELKQSIARIDPEVHAQITRLQEGTKRFQEIAAEKQFEQVITLDQAGECRIDLIDGKQIECLVKALDTRGNWTGLTHDGVVVEFSREQVMEL